VTLPLVYLRIPNPCPLPLQRLTFLIRLAYAYSEQLRERMTQEYVTARTWASRLAQTIESGGLHPLRPYTNNVTLNRTQYEGELIEEPRQLSNPEIYEWKRRGSVMKMPWYIGQQSAVSDALVKINVLETFRALIEKLCKGEGITGDYDAPLLWMLFTPGLSEAFELRKGVAATLSAVGDILLSEYLMQASYAELLVTANTVLRGIKYQADKEKQNGKTDV